MPSSDSDAVAIGVDVGGTKCLAVLIDSGGRPVRDAQVATPQGSDAVLDAVAEVIGAVSGGQDAGLPVGVGMPGIIDRDGLFILGPNVPGLIDLDVSAELRDRTGHAVHVDNDATAAAWGEFTCGAAKDATSAVVLTLGTGIGGAVISDGQLIRGQRGFTAEPGHMVVNRGGRACACGRFGCWESYASGTGLLALARDHNPLFADAESVTAAARDGDNQAREVMAEFGEWVGIGVTNLVNLLAPEVVVIGGGLVAAYDLYSGEISRVLASEAMGPHLAATPVRPATLGVRAGAIGAGLLAVHTATVH